MKRYLYPIALMFAFAVPNIALAQSFLNDSLVQQLNTGVEGFKERYHSPSIVLLIVHDKQVIYSRASGYIDVENKVPATVDARYPVMSMTKLFTATMMMQLMQNKVVKFDDDVRKYLPEFRLSNTTLFQLATHTSGLPRNSPADLNFTQQIDRWVLTGANYGAIEPSTKQQLLLSLKYIKYEYPKYQFLRYSDRHYSNLGYSMLGIALERAAKKDYASYLTANVFRPLQMYHSGFITTKAQKGALANGYMYDEQTATYKQTPFFKPNSASYAGGMYTTANDMAKFLCFQFAQNSQVLSEENKAMMVALNIGWKPSYPYTTHEGSILGYRSEIVFNPAQKFGWVILTNTNNFDFSRINEYINKILTPVFNKTVSLPLEKYAGTYVLTGNAGSLKIYLKDGALYSTYLTDKIPNKPLTPSGRNTFDGAGKNGYNINYEFLTDRNGEVAILNMGQFMWQKVIYEQ